MASTVDIINKFKLKYAIFYRKQMDIFFRNEKNFAFTCETNFSGFVSRFLYELFVGKEPFLFFPCKPFEGITGEESFKFINNLKQEEKNSLYITVDKLSFSWT